MTFFTLFLAQQKYVAIHILFGVCLILSASANGQTGVDLKPSIGTSSEACDQDRSSELRVETKDANVQTVGASFSKRDGRRSETNPKPHAGISIGVDDREAMDEDDVVEETPAAPVVVPSRFFSQSGQPKFGPPGDPSWRPFQAPKHFDTGDDDDEDDDAAAQNRVSNKFHWRPAVLQSIMIQGVQHAYAIVLQERMRQELKGPFFRDWFKSVRGLKGWDDGNRFFTNYVAHPMQGAMTGFIFLQNHDRLKRQKFGESKTYWNDRLKAMLWSAAWSTQWELGPMSQASIGNVGLNGKGMAYVDLVVTPTIGTAWMVVEEAIDRYVIRHLEGRTPFVIKIFLRTVLNPMRGVANVLRFKEPWKRDRPFGH